MITCREIGLTEFQLDGPKRGGIAWAEDQIVASGILNRRTKLKRLSAKTIAVIVERMAAAEEWRDERQCENEY